MNPDLRTEGDKLDIQLYHKRFYKYKRLGYNRYERNILVDFNLVLLYMYLVVEKSKLMPARGPLNGLSHYKELPKNDFVISSQRCPGQCRLLVIDIKLIENRDLFSGQLNCQLLGKINLFYCSVLLGLAKTWGMLVKGLIVTTKNNVTTTFWIISVFSNCITTISRVVVIFTVNPEIFRPH